MRVMVMVGWWFTWLTRTMLPCDGDMDGKLTLMLKVGVKFSGMGLDGRRFALRSEVRRVEDDMVVVGKPGM